MARTDEWLDAVRRELGLEGATDRAATPNDQARRG